MDAKLNDRRSIKSSATKMEDLRRRRDETLVEIRKTKREESLAKRRNLVPISSMGLKSAASEELVCIAHPKG